MNPTVLLCVDGGDFRVVAGLVEAGRMPAMRELLGRGSIVHLLTCSRIIEPATWGPLLSGQAPGDLGFHHFEEFDPATMGTRFQQELLLEPLWLHLPGRGADVLTLDVPDCHPHPRSAATEACGWHAASPAHRPLFTDQKLRRRLRALGRPPSLTNHPEALGPQIEQRLSERLAGSVSFRARTLDAVGTTRPLTCIGIHELHCAVHGLGHHGPDQHWFAPDRKDPELLARVYRAVDQLIGSVAARANGANLVLALARGSRPANHAGQLLEGMLERAGLLTRSLGAGVAETPATTTPGVVERVRALVPEERREQLAVRLLPTSVQHRLAAHRFRDRYAWEQTKLFPAPSWAEGFLRVNMSGRESAGIVPPHEADALLERASALIRETVDADSGTPLADEIIRPRDHFPGAEADRFPDLIVTWRGDRPARAARHPKLGTWSQPPRPNLWTEHRAEAEVIVSGPQIRAGLELQGDELSLAPTMLALLGQRPPGSMTGQVWSDLLRDRGA